MTAAVIDWEDGETRTVQWLPRHLPLPAGATDHGPGPSHHGAFSRLIERVSMRRLDKFDADTKTVTDERGAVYAHPSIDFDRVARLKVVVADCKNPLARHALEMICVKIARLINSPDHLDSWVDIAGYARTGVMVTEP